MLLFLGTDGRKPVQLSRMVNFILSHSSSVLYAKLLVTSRGEQTFMVWLRLVCEQFDCIDVKYSTQTL